MTPTCAHPTASFQPLSLSLPHSYPSLISPSSVLNYPAILLFSRGGWCWRSAEELSCAVCFTPSLLPPLTSAAQEKTNRGEEGAGGEGGKLPTQKGLRERAKAGQQRHVWWSGERDTLNFQQGKRLDRRDRWIKKLTEERLTYYGSTRDFLA